MEKISPVIVALDLETKEEALRIVEETKEFVDIYKVGPVLFIRYGPFIVEEIISLGKKVFLDLKLHDIPNTVKNAVASAASLGVFMITVHLSGGTSMMEAALEGKRDGLPLILGVSVLTSMDQEDLREIGLSCGVEEQVKRLVVLAAKSGIDGVVCSPREVELVKGISSSLTIVVPGVRPTGYGADDQKRVMTPQDALRAGATFVVMGRPVYQSSSPGDVVKSVVENIRLF